MGVEEGLRGGDDGVVRVGFWYLVRWGEFLEGALFCQGEEG